MKFYDRKKAFIIGMIAAVSICVITVGGTVYASAGDRRDGIESRGAINYDRGKVVIDSADFITLADEIDKLELSYKTDITDALAGIGTYIQQDGSAGHDAKANIDPQQVAFRNLESGILQSQSVDSLSGRQASDTGGVIYYKYASRNILEVTRSNTGMPVYIVPAQEDNLSAQTAAWVNGHSIVGNGSDNYYFYQKGFIEGYAARVGATVEYQYDNTGKIESARLVFP